jgi:membrane protein required for colicin V production
MQFQILDFILVGIMLLSGILALARGFTREVLSLIAWALAAVAAYFAIQQQQLIDLVKPYVDSNKPENGTLELVIVGAIAFVVVLIVVSIISVKLSDNVVDSAVGAFDRTLGFFYGLLRGLVFVGILYLVYAGWLQPNNKQEDWIRNAQTLPVIQGTSDFIWSAIEVAATLRKSMISNAQDEAAAPDSNAPGYSNSQSQGLDNLIEGQQPAQPPAQPSTQGTTQP